MYNDHLFSNGLNNFVKIHNCFTSNKGKWYSTSLPYQCKSLGDACFILQWKFPLDLFDVF